MADYLLKNATLLTFYPARVEEMDVRISGGKISEKGAALPKRDGETVLDLSGKFLAPGMVCAHTHLYSSLSRGMPGPQEPPANFPQILGLHPPVSTPHLYRIRGQDKLRHARSQKRAQHFQIDSVARYKVQVVMRIILSRVVGHFDRPRNVRDQQLGRADQFRKYAINGAKPGPSLLGDVAFTKPRFVRAQVCRKTGMVFELD